MSLGSLGSVNAKAEKLRADAPLACASSGDALCAPLRIPVKTSGPCPKERIPDLLADIYGTRIPLPVRVGDVIITNWNGCGIDVVASRNIA